MVNDSTRKRLKEIFASRVLFSIEARLCYSFDATNVEYLPDCVAFPVVVEEVVEAAKAVDKIDLPVEFADMRNILAILLNSSYPGSGLTGDDIKETVRRGHEKINKIEDEVRKRLEGVQ